MRKDLADLVIRSIGESVTVQQVVDELFAKGAIMDVNARKVLIYSEFFRMYQAHPELSAMEIEWRLSTRYGISRERVRDIRLKAVKAKRGAAGRK